VMGTSKLMGERLISAANACHGGEGRVFASTRFGNVLGSRGSVLPLFRKQIAAGGPVTLTHPDMTRFVMTLGEAVKLVMKSTFMAQGGEVFVTKMPAVRIADVAEAMIDELAPRYGREPHRIEMVEIGPKPGEKMYEELLTQEESVRAWELDRYFVVPPAFGHEDVRYDYPNMRPASAEQPYNSGLETPMTKDQLRAFLRETGLLEDGGEDPNADLGFSTRPPRVRVHSA